MRKGDHYDRRARESINIEAEPCYAPQFGSARDRIRL